MFARPNRVIGALYLASDAVAALVSFWTATLLRASLISLQPLYPVGNYLWIVPVAVAIWVLAGLAAGIYGEIREEETRRIITDPLKVAVLATTVLFAFTFAFKLEYISRLLLGLFAAVDFAAMVSLRLAARALSDPLRRRFQGLRHFLLVGSTPEAVEIARMIEANERRGMRLVGFAELSPGAAQDLLQVAKLRGHYATYALAELADLLRRHVIDEVICAVKKDELESLEETFLVCEEEGVRTRLVLSFFPHVNSRVQLDRLKELPLLTFSTTPENEDLLLVKRLADFAMAFALLVLLLPLLLILGVVVKLTSKGPVFYRQTRCGLGGRKFTLYKFRSMFADAERRRGELERLNELDGPVFKIRNDPRLTGPGRFMRKFSLDELPQLFNILRGDMSFVGPRPPLPEEVEKYEPWQRRRLRMQPGLTCLWALEGRNRLDFKHWMELDLQYIDNWSPALDWKILLKTIPVVLLGRGAS